MAAACLSHFSSWRLRGDRSLMNNKSRHSCFCDCGSFAIVCTRKRGRPSNRSGVGMQRLPRTSGRSLHDCTSVCYDSYQLTSQERCDAKRFVPISDSAYICAAQHGPYVVAGDFQDRRMKLILLQWSKVVVCALISHRS